MCVRVWMLSWHLVCMLGGGCGAGPQGWGTGSSLTPLSPDSATDGIGLDLTVPFPKPPPKATRPACPASSHAVLRDALGVALEQADSLPGVAHSGWQWLLSSPCQSAGTATHKPPAPSTAPLLGSGPSPLPVALHSANSSLAPLPIRGGQAHTSCSWGFAWNLLLGGREHRERLRPP